MRERKRDKNTNLGLHAGLLKLLKYSGGNLALCFCDHTVSYSLKSWHQTYHICIWLK